MRHLNLLALILALPALFAAARPAHADPSGCLPDSPKAPKR